MGRSRRFPKAGLTVTILAVSVLCGCASRPPGSDFPKSTSVALAEPSVTTLGRRFAIAARANGGNSGFRVISAGVDGFLTRMEMINAAERTLDLQYFILRGDETGRLLTDAVLRAADRGVRVRVLIDDGETIRGDDQITPLAAHRSIEIRIFNPFAYRGHIKLLRAAEFTFNASRLDYRMHNKLLVVDNAVALIGGRNIGDQYFQVDPDSQFADDDVFAAGPIVGRMSATFDEYWNSALAIPNEALSKRKSSHAALEQREDAVERRPRLEVEGIDYMKQVSTGEPFAGMISGRLPLVWAHADLVCDSPDKKSVEKGWMVGRLMQHAVADAAAATRSELLIVTPYLVPGDEGLKVFQNLRGHGVRIRILTTGLESSNMLLAQSGYLKYRVPLLEDGVELYEIRSLLGNSRGSGQTAAISRYGNYSLHAKLFVFDRKRLFIGSMNFDQRSMHLNTEIGLLIDSPELARKVATRFEAMVQPANAYALALQPDSRGKTSHIVWRTEEAGEPVEYAKEPSRSAWERFEVKLLSFLPIERQL